MAKMVLNELVQEDAAAAGARCATPDHAGPRARRPGAARTREPEQVEQVLLNLVLNSADAIAGEGRITVSTRVRRLRPETPGDGERGRKLVELEVRDTGCGIPPDLQTRIFDPFSPPNRTARARAWGWPWWTASCGRTAAVLYDWPAG